VSGPRLVQPETGPHRAPALAPGDETTWVYTTPHRVKGGAAFARVGVPTAPPIAVPHQLPALKASGSARGKGDKLEVSVNNTSGVTQYDVAVYAAAKRGGRLVAAGQASVVKIDPGTTAAVPLKLIGDARGAAISVYAPATIFE